MGPYCKGNMTSRIEGEKNLSEISVSQSKNAYAFSFQIVFCNKFRLKNKLQDRERVLTYPNSNPTQVLSVAPTVSTAQGSSPGHVSPVSFNLEYFFSLPLSFTTLVFLKVAN